MADLPAHTTGGSLPAMPSGRVPSDIRRRALNKASGVLRELSRLAKHAEKEHVRVMAGKAVLHVAAVTGSSSVPKDLVYEKTERTARLLRERLGDAVYATLADDLSRIWDI